MLAPTLGLTDIPVIQSSVLPLAPSHREDARRIVRHGLSDVLEWLGEDVGPRPGELTHAFVIDGTLYLSPETFRRLLESSAP